MVLVASSAEFDAKLAECKGLMVVDFFATWCPPCRRIAPLVAQWAEENPEVTFVKVDVDQVSDLGQRMGVRAMPTFIFIKDGKKVDEVVGANVPQIVEFIAKHK
ncbi:thioredoxin [Kipferlia bialata]|uniref:Thioredoxin n=1 Tax=Kipferlia bialata TaxID=797122 RepID=A0A9K3CW04_9EUKA|nr:thioredoxin [Kipferlia bialata]|eukprot:g5796.t1